MRVVTKNQKGITTILALLAILGFILIGGYLFLSMKYAQNFSVTGDKINCDGLQFTIPAGWNAWSEDGASGLICVVSTWPKESAPEYYNRQEENLKQVLIMVGFSDYGPDQSDTMSLKEYAEFTAEYIKSSDKSIEIKSITEIQNSNNEMLAKIVYKQSNDATDTVEYFYDDKPNRKFALITVSNSSDELEKQASTTIESLKRVD